MGKPYVRREAQLKAEVLQIVERSPLPVRQTLQELQIAPSTYYRWKSRYRDQGFNGLVDRPPEPRRVWNRLATKQRRYVVRYALEHPSLSPREVATTLVDEQVMYVSESTVYRVLKEAGLIKPPETKGFPAGKEFHTKTARPNELWQTDASYFFVVGWGYYYLISVLDDYSRMIVGWRVQTSMSSADIIEVVQDAVEFTGQDVHPRPTCWGLPGDRGLAPLRYPTTDKRKQPPSPGRAASCEYRAARKSGNSQRSGNFVRPPPDRGGRMQPGHLPERAVRPSPLPGWRL